MKTSSLRSDVPLLQMLAQVQTLGKIEHVQEHGPARRCIGNVNLLAAIRALESALDMDGRVLKVGSGEDPAFRINFRQNRVSYRALEQ